MVGALGGVGVWGGGGGAGEGGGEEGGSEWDRQRRQQRARLGSLTAAGPPPPPAGSTPTAATTATPAPSPVMRCVGRRVRLRRGPRPTHPPLAAPPPAASAPRAPSHPNPPHPPVSQVFVPATDESQVPLHGFAAFRAFMLAVQQLLGWPSYLFFNAAGREYSRFACHFDPYRCVLGGSLCGGMGGRLAGAGWGRPHPHLTAKAPRCLSPPPFPPPTPPPAPSSPSVSASRSSSRTPRWRWCSTAYTTSHVSPGCAARAGLTVLF
jgi:hypothetical protein